VFIFVHSVLLCEFISIWDKVYFQEIYIHIRPHISLNIHEQLGSLTLL